MNHHTVLLSTAASSRVELGTSADQSSCANCREGPFQSETTEGLMEQPEVSRPGHPEGARKLYLPLEPRLTRNRIAPNDVRDPTNQAVGRSFEPVAPGPTSDLELVPSLDEGIGCERHGSSDLTLTHPLSTSLNSIRDDQDDVPSVGDRLDNSPFRTLTIDDEDKRRKILGTYLDTSFPDIPDIFMNCQEYIADLTESSRADGKSPLEEGSEPNETCDSQNSTQSRDPTHKTPIAAEDEDEQEAQACNFHVDLLMSRNVSSDIVSQLGHMPVSSLNAFMDGEDEIGEHAENVTRFEAIDILKGVTNHPAKGCVAPRTPETCAITTGNEEHQVILDVERRQLSISPTAQSGLLLGETEEGRCDEGAFSLDDVLASGNPRNENFECNERNQDNECGSLTEQTVLRDRTNHQTDSQGLTMDRVRELFLAVNEFSRKMRIQARSGSDSLKYYSLGRMQKDLTENLDLSEQLVLAVLKLREQKASLDEACRKEREGITRLREILGVRGLLPMKER